MIAQWESSSSISSNWLNYFYSKIGPLDEYVILQTGDGSYGCIIRRIPSREIVQYNINRTGSGYGSYSYSLSESEPDSFSYSINNELYVYSNVGYGTMAVLPCHEIMVCWGITGLVCLVFLMLLFKGSLFKCLRKKS